MSWKNGPLPPDTWNWGGVVLKDENSGGGFWFADFCGDHVLLQPAGTVVPACEVALYDNSLELPPGKTARCK